MNRNLWECEPVNEDRGRQRLAEAVTAERKRRYRTVTKAHNAAGISRGAWESVEAGKRVKGPTLTAVEIALDWPIGQAERVIEGSTASVLDELDDADRRLLADLIGDAPLREDEKDRLIRLIRDRGAS